ncbi:sensor histidine kinase [Amphibiibacter pelophylacis]|uniref:ATP-binding protein n=1 Tax=Amphibiibacter pelophylacis TaxID=1799477 RepID=A0ACC6P0W7_9BURK
MSPLPPVRPSATLRLAAAGLALRDLCGAAPDPLAPQWPVYLRYVRVRVFVALALLAVQLLLSTSSADVGKNPVQSLVPATLYALQALLWLGLVVQLEQRQRRRRLSDGPAPPLPAWHRPWLLAVGSDLVFFSWLYWGEPAGGLNHAALFVLPVLMAGLLMSRSTALVTSTLAAVILLAPFALALDPFPQSLVQLGRGAVVVAGMYLLGFLAQGVSQRTLHERAQVQEQRELVRQQALLNAMVIGDMDEGVLVVDNTGSVHSANPAARALLGHQGLLPVVPFDLAGQSAWTELHASVRQAFAQPAATDSVQALIQSRRQTVTLHFASGLQRALVLRIRIATHDRGGHQQPVCVVFMEDQRTEQGRHRQERLATMGRFSAGIAHEFRNPLAAIAQANQLLHEDLTDPVLQRLSDMIAANVSRLRRIVDDVMDTAADPQQIQSRPLMLDEQIAEVLRHWAPGERQADAADCPTTAASTPPLAPDLVLQLSPGPAGASFWFDAQDFHRVCVNLLDNAWRHCRRQIGSIQISVRAAPALPGGGSGWWLDVASDGSPIPPAVHNHLFEPFYSTRSRGTGLGLYLCRELCDRHGAQLGYLLGEDALSGQPLNVFRVTLRAA